MIKEATLCGRTLILPRFTLSAGHNLGRSRVSQMDEYFDMDNVMIDGKVASILKEWPVVNLDKCLKVGKHDPIEDCSDESIVRRLGRVVFVRLALRRFYGRRFHLSLHVPVHPSLAQIAASLKKQIPNDAAWIHVRRGDRLPQTGAYTTPESIMRTLQRICPDVETLYIASDERTPGFFKPLSSRYRVITKNDIKLLMNLEREDNYKLFLVEKHFGESLPIRISTFKTKSKDYHGSLCSAFGYQ